MSLQLITHNRRRWRCTHQWQRGCDKYNAILKDYVIFVSSVASVPLRVVAKSGGDRKVIRIYHRIKERVLQ